MAVVSRFQPRMVFVVDQWSNVLREIWYFWYGSSCSWRGQHHCGWYVGGCGGFAGTSGADPVQG